MLDSCQNGFNLSLISIYNNLLFFLGLCHQQRKEHYECVIYRGFPASLCMMLNVRYYSMQPKHSILTNSANIIHNSQTQTVTKRCPERSATAAAAVSITCTNLNISHFLMGFQMDFHRFVRECTGPFGSILYTPKIVLL